MTTEASTHVKLQTRVFTAAARPFGRHGQTFAPTTSTLVVGDEEAVLIDAQYIDTDVTAVGDMIEQTGRRLTAIYITHGHADHFLGLGQLTRRFPSARPLATASVLASIHATLDGQLKQWKAMFGDEVAEGVVIPDPLASEVIELEGNAIRVIEVGQGDIHPSTVVHIPSMDTVIAGDVVYNRIHPMLALTGVQGWETWIHSIDLVAALGANTIVAGHKRPEASDRDLATILEGTRGYICDFREAVQGSASAEEVVKAMRSRYPDYGNLTTLIVSARAAFPLD